MSAATVAPAATCPPWCVATHADGSDVHLQDDTAVKDIYGNLVPISAWWDESGGKAGIYLGGEEFSVDQLDALEDAIRVAKQAARLVTR